MLRTCLAALALLSLALPAAAQTPPTARVRGTLEQADGRSLVVRTKGGESVPVTLADTYTVIATVKASIADVKPGSYVGSAAVPQPDGTLRALELHIFPEAMHGANEGHRPYDLAPESTMTNASVDSIVSGVNGPTLTVKYKDGSKVLVITTQTSVVAFAPADKAEVVVGTPVVVTVARQADGSLLASRVVVGREGQAPPL